MTVAIIQARMGATRLPGKVLREILGKPILWHVIERIKRCKLIDQVIIATTNIDGERPILELAKRMGIASYSGSEDDVLDRYYQAAKRYQADIIVRITSDCPLVDPQVTDKVVKFFLDNKPGFNYVSNTLNPTYPDGLDTEVFSFATMEKAWKEAKLKSEREHVTAYIVKHPEIFKLGNVENEEDLSHMRWTVDEERDFEFVKKVYERLYKPNQVFLMRDILALLKAYPDLADINKGINRNEGYIKSVLSDKV